MSHSTICFWIDWERVYAYTKVKGLEISVIAKKQKRDEHGASFQKKKRAEKRLHF